MQRAATCKGITTINMGAKLPRGRPGAARLYDASSCPQCVKGGHSICSDIAGQANGRIRTVSLCHKGAYQVWLRVFSILPLVLALRRMSTSAPRRQRHYALPGRLQRRSCWRPKPDIANRCRPTF